MFDYVYRLPKGPAAVIRVVGQALHYHMHRFFTDNFTSPDSFADAWVGFWLGVANGEHGAEGFNRRPEPIAWSEVEKEKKHWLIRGREIVEDFFLRNVSRRDAGAVRLMEQDFKVDWCGLRLTGKIDRVELVDYKLRRFPEYELVGLDQATFYWLAYQHLFRSQVFGGKPLTVMRLETSGTWGDKAYQEVTLPGALEEQTLLEVLTTASTCVWSLRNGKQLPEGSRPRLTYLPSDGTGNPMLYPRFPRGKHCEECDYVPQCVVWEKENRESLPPDVVLQLQQHRARKHRESMPMQEVIHFSSVA